MLIGRRAFLGSLARFQAIAAGAVAAGTDPAKIPTPYEIVEPIPAKRELTAEEIEASTRAMQATVRAQKRR